MDARELVLPPAEEWTKAVIPKVETELLDGTRVVFPEHEIEVANRYQMLGMECVAQV